MASGIVYAIGSSMDGGGGGDGVGGLSPPALVFSSSTAMSSNSSRTPRNFLMTPSQLIHSLLLDRVPVTLLHGPAGSGRGMRSGVRPRSEFRRATNPTPRVPSSTREPSAARLYPLFRR